MNKSELKRVIGKIEPDQNTKDRLSEKLKRKPKRRLAVQPLAAIAAGLVIVIGVSIFAGNISQNPSVYIPKVTIQENTGIAAKMMPLIVYKGRIYLDNGAQINPDNAEKLLGEKLGTTKANLTEWSKQDDYAVEFASTVGEQDVFTVKGYDPGFRIMTLDRNNGEIFAQIFECLNDISVRSGKDIFEKFKLKGNIITVTYEDFDSWNNGKGNYQKLSDLEGVSRFLEALNLSVPYKQESLPQLFDDQSPNGQKFIYLILKDGSGLQLRLFRDGYVYLNNIDIFFKVEDTAFNTFWSKLD
ncbi:MAG: hypothetical protein APF84_09405 [Gracilibacter sp. BRH_c7a]|nr:MAG: hypothetical protein APF84_09405 [Gracilibacter sp. BRH_c7a]